MNLKEEYVLNPPKEAPGQFKMTCWAEQQRIARVKKRGQRIERAPFLTKK